MPHVRILTFHGIGPPDRPLEPGEAPFWVGIDQFVAILDRVATHPDRASFAITFDDGNFSDLRIAAPHLVRRGLRGTFFVLTGRIGQRGSLNANDVRELMMAGMLIGSHGVAHRDWTRLNGPGLRHELIAARMTLEEICRQPIQTAAIPFGRYNAAVLRALRTARYHTVYSSDRGSADAAAFLKPRTSIRSDTTEAELERILSGRLPLLQKMRRDISMRLKQLS